MKQKQIWLLGVSFLLLTACGPGHTAQKYLENIQKGNFRGAYQYVSSPDRKYMNLSEFTARVQEEYGLQDIGHERLKMALGNMKFEIKEVEKTAWNEASVTYKNKVPDVGRLQKMSETPSKLPMLSRQDTFLMVRDNLIFWKLFLNQERTQKLSMLEKALDGGHGAKAKQMADHIEKRFPKDAYIQEQVDQARRLIEGQSYAQKSLKLLSLKVSRHSTLKKFVNIQGAIQNSGKKSVNKLVIEIQYMDANKQIIYKENYHLLDPEGFALVSNNAPLEPGRKLTFQFGDSQVPLSHWSGKYRSRILQTELGVF